MKGDNVRIYIDRSSVYQGLIKLRCISDNGGEITDDMLAQALMDYAVLVLEDQDKDTGLN